MATATATLIRSLGDSRAYAAAVAKLRELQATESRLKLEIADAEGRLKEDQTPAVREYAVQSLLAGNDYHRAPGRHELNSQLLRLREEAGIVRSAITEQQQTVNSARAEASREICKGAKPQHDSSLRALVTGALGVPQAALITAQIRNRLDSADVSLNSLPSLNFGEFGLAALEPYSQLSHLVREALSLGVIERSDVPAGWLARWGL